MSKCTRSSILVHRTLALCFKGGYEHRRIDITMRFGLRRAPSLFYDGVDLFSDRHLDSVAHRELAHGARGLHSLGDGGHVREDLPKCLALTQPEADRPISAE